MCYNCGCSNPQDDMGNPDNITEQVLKRLAEDQDLKEFKKELLTQLKSGKLDPKFEIQMEKAAKAWGQSVEEAKKNTQSLLQSQVG